MRGLYACALAGLLALTACGKSADEPADSAAPASAPAAAPAPDPVTLSGPISELVDCAGAYAAAGGIDPASTSNDMSNPWFQTFMDAQMKISGAEGKPDPATLSRAIKERADHWKAQDKTDVTARAEACKATG